ncbi:MAG: hypothetical protein JWO36_5268 [Myxococcales bacterium]|nr:hypothetical protein [Myxococcales bacterium]
MRLPEDRAGLGDSGAEEGDGEAGGSGGAAGGSAGASVGSLPLISDQTTFRI